MIPSMRGDQFVEKDHPPPSTSSIIPTTGSITTRNESSIQMKSVKGRINLIGNHLIPLPKL